MHKITSCLAIAAAALCAAGAEIDSHFVRRTSDRLFYTYADWLPTSVATNWTPGSDCMITVMTNRTFSEWQLSSSSKTDWDPSLGETTSYLGTKPQWTGSEWSPADYIFSWGKRDYGSFYFMVYNYRDNTHAYDENATEIEYGADGNLVAESGEPLGSDHCQAYFYRSMAVDPYGKSKPKRLTPELHASFIRTLDGWCEREFFGGVAQNYPTQDLATVTLNTLNSRVAESRRLEGITNLWKVADKMQALCASGWRSEALNSVPSDYRVQPYWSSTLFDTIYGSQIPSAIAWTEGGMESLSNKCAVFRGLESGDVWTAPHNNGWLYSDLVPEDFAYGTTNATGTATGGHDFDFAALVSTNYVSMVNCVSNQTRRLDLDYWAGVNQAEAVMDRTLNPMGRTAPATGTKTTYSLVRVYKTSKLPFEEYFYEYGTAWKSDTDAGFSTFYEYTNYLESASEAWTPESSMSDAVELSQNSVSQSRVDGENWGTWYITAQSVVDGLNAKGAVGVAGETYTAYHGYTYTDQGNVVFRVYVNNGAGDYLDCTFPYFPTNTCIELTLTVKNAVDFCAGATPSYAAMKFMPSGQAWAVGSGRQASATDICTASIAICYQGSTNVVMHCNQITRGSGTDLATVHANEWSIHRSRILAELIDLTGFDLSNPAPYVTFTRGQISAYLDELLLYHGTYGFSWPSSSTKAFSLGYSPTGDWYILDGGTITLSATPSFSLRIGYEYPGPSHTVPTKDPCEVYCRQNIMNVVDWTWNSAREE